MAGYYGKSSFIDWIKSDVAKEKGYKLTSEDWKALSNGDIE